MSKSNNHNLRWANAIYNSTVNLFPILTRKIRRLKVSQILNRINRFLTVIIIIVVVWYLPRAKLPPLKYLLTNVSKRIWPDIAHTFKKYKYKTIISNQQQQQSKLMVGQSNKSQYKTTIITNSRAVFQSVVIEVLTSWAYNYSCRRKFPSKMNLTCILYKRKTAWLKFQT